jgi:hypothetical protein
MVLIRMIGVVFNWVGVAPGVQKLALLNAVCRRQKQAARANGASEKTLMWLAGAQVTPPDFRCKDETCRLGDCLSACAAVKPRFKE